MPYFLIINDNIYIFLVINLILRETCDIISNSILSLNIFEKVSCKFLLVKKNLHQKILQCSHIFFGSWVLIFKKVRAGKKFAIRSKRQLTTKPTTLKT